MRLAARFVVGVLVVLLLAGAALYAMRTSIAAASVEHILGGFGFIEPSAKVADVSLDRLTIAELQAGPGGSARALSLELHRA